MSDSGVPPLTADDLAGVLDHFNFRLRLDVPCFPDTRGAIHELNGTQIPLDLKEVVHRHPQDGFTTELKADTAKTSRQFAQRRRQERNPFVLRTRCGPGPNAADRVRCYNGLANFGNDRNRLASRGNDKEPGACRALPELRVVACEVAIVWRRGNNQTVQLVDAYIRWYNEKRIKVSPGSLSPLEYRESPGLAA